MKERALATRSCTYVLSVFRDTESLRRPIKSSFVFGVRHLGQGHNPLSRIVANKTLVDEFSMNKGVPIGKNTLLGVISRVSEEPRIDTTLNPVSALDDHAVLECIYKRVVEEKVPYSMDQLATTMR